MSQHAEALVGSTADASAELVELRKPESLGVLYHHHGGVGDIHAYLYHCGGHHYLGFVFDEQLHLVVFFLRLHLAVDVDHIV